MNGLRVASPLPEDLEALIRSTIGALLSVHRELGPGMSESVYSRACCVELQHRAIPFEVETPIPVMYRGKLLCHHRMDLLIDRRLVVEIKAVERIHSVHVAQVVSYLRAATLRAGLVVNFNVAVLKQGIRRVVL
jgi:GxxExxY protein